MTADPFEGQTSWRAQGPGGEWEMISSQEELQVLAYFATQGEHGSVDDLEIAELAGSLNQDGWSGKNLGMSQPTSPAAVYWSLVSEGAPQPLTLWHRGARLLVKQVAGRVGPDHPTVELMKKARSWTPGLVVGLGTKKTSSLLKVVFADDDDCRAPEAKLATLEALIKKAPNRTVAEELLPLTAEPGFQTLLEEKILPFAGRQGWDSNVRGDDNHITTRVARALAEQPAEEWDEDWEKLKAGWDLVTPDSYRPNDSFRRMIALLIGPDSLSPEVAEARLERLEAVVELEPSIKRAFSVSLLAEIHGRGFDFEEEVQIVSKLAKRLSRCEDGLGVRGFILRDRYDRFSNYQQDRSILFSTFDAYHPEDHSKLMAWHFAASEVAKLKRLNELLPDHNLRFAPTRDAMRMSGKEQDLALAPLFRGCGDVEKAVEWTKGRPQELLLDEELAGHLERLAQLGSVAPFVDGQAIREHSPGGDQDLADFAELLRACEAHGTPERAGEAFTLYRQLPGDRESLLPEVSQMIGQVGVEGLKLSLLDRLELGTGQTRMRWEDEGILIGEDWIDIRQD